MHVRRILLALFLGLLLVAPAQSAWAGPPRTQFTITVTVVRADTPQRQWIDDEGVLHVRGQRFEDQVTGDLSGTQVSVGDIDLNLATGEGTGRAHLVLTTDQGTWAGRLGGPIHQFSFSGRLEGHGRDGSPSTQIRATFAQTGVNPEQFLVHGTLHTGAA